MLALGAMAVFGISRPSSACACSVEGASAYQPQYAEVSQAMRSAATGSLGSSYPAPPQLETGYPDPTTLTGFTIPCVIVNAVGYIESSWRQAYATPRGEIGPALVSGSCGYGIMQITSGMVNPGDLPAEVQWAIATDYIYNVAYGVKMLGDKWNLLDWGGWGEPIVGDRNPGVAEDWYFAVWAYNNFSYKNHPGNPDYPWPRAPYDGSQSYTDYPYQELVWGRAANPPTVDGSPLWTGVALTLPNRDDISWYPSRIPTPSPSHGSDCAPPSSYPYKRYLPLATKQ